MSALGNLLWFVFGGLVMGMGWWLAGLLAFVSIGLAAVPALGFGLWVMPQRWRQTIATVVATPSRRSVMNAAAMTMPSHRLCTLLPMRIMPPERLPGGRTVAGP